MTLATRIRRAMPWYPTHARIRRRLSRPRRIVLLREPGLTVPYMEQVRDAVSCIIASNAVEVQHAASYGPTAFNRSIYPRSLRIQVFDKTAQQRGSGESRCYIRGTANWWTGDAVVYVKHFKPLVAANIICHEVGHLLGFIHSDWSGTIMTSGWGNLRNEPLPWAGDGRND